MTLLTGNDAMSKLLEIFGKGLTVNTAEIVGNWLSQKLSYEEPSVRIKILSEINSCLANRELDHAENKIQEYLSDFRECILGRMAAVTLCLLQNDPEEAIKQAQSVYLRQPSNTMALYVMGYCSERLGQTAQALEFYQDCIKFKSFLQLPRQRMAAIYLKEGQLERAAKEYEILTSEHPDDITSIILLGYLYLELDKNQQAIDTFNLGILSHPDNFSETGGNEEIQAYIESEMFEEALNLVKSIMDQIGLSYDLIVQMGDIYSQWGKESESIACFENAKLMQPNSLEARIKLGTHYLRNQQFSLAAEELNKASDINDEIVDAYMGLAIAQKKHGQDDDSNDTLGLALSISKNSILLHTEATTLLCQAILNENSNIHPGSHNEAVSIKHVIKASQKRIRKKGCQAGGYNQYGILMTGEGNVIAAVCAFKNSLTENGRDYRVLYKLVLSYVDSAQTEKALNALMGYNQRDAVSFEKYYQTSMLCTNKIKLASALKKVNAKNASESYETNTLQDDVQQIFITLGIMDRSDANWQQINGLSRDLLEIFENKRQCGQFSHD
jgi:tetratricopeptide (TPR) repeat protein